METFAVRFLPWYHDVVDVILHAIVCVVIRNIFKHDVFVLTGSMFSVYEHLKAELKLSLTLGFILSYNVPPSAWCFMEFIIFSRKLVQARYSDKMVARK